MSPNDNRTNTRCEKNCNKSYRDGSNSTCMNSDISSEASTPFLPFKNNLEKVSVVPEKNLFLAPTHWSNPDPASMPLEPSSQSAMSIRTSFDLEFINLSYSVPNHTKKGQKTILNKISGKFRAGQLTAIMGPSGAGKSTLLNVLTGYRTSNVCGTILLNGKERNLRQFRRHSCYIMQEDSLLQFLTVQESMQVAADLKLGDQVDMTKKKEIIREVLASLKLQETTFTRVSNLSGGEKKRLSIALELVNNPPIMFFDEPTSGLDSQNSLLCVSLLKTLASEGRTIVCTIHQPSAHVFETFDQVYAMGDGQCIYSGNVESMVPFLSTFGLECPQYHNQADFVIEIASGHYGSYIPQLSAAIKANGSMSVSKQNNVCDLVNNHSMVSREAFPSSKLKSFHKNNTTILDVGVQEKLLNTESRSSSRFPASFPRQCCILFDRTFKSIVRDKMLTQLRFLAHVVVGIFIGLLYYQSGNEASSVNSSVGGVFFNILFLLFTSMMPTVVTFPLEMPVLQREHLNHWYSLKSYYIAKTMADFPFQVLFPVLYIVIVYFMTAQPMELYRLLFFMYFTIMTSLVAQSAGLAIGAAVDIQQSVFCGPVSAIPALLFSGFFVSYHTMPKYLRWLTYTSYLRYGYEGSLISIYGLERDSLECSTEYCHFKHPSKILQFFDINEDFFMWDLIILFCYFIVVRILGYFILRWKLRSTR